MPRSRESSTSNFINANTEPSRARRWLNNFLDFISFTVFLCRELYNDLFVRDNSALARLAVAILPAEAPTRSQSSTAPAQTEDNEHDERRNAENNPRTLSPEEQAVLNIGIRVIAGTLIVGGLFFMTLAARERSTVDRSNHNGSRRSWDETFFPSTELQNNQQIINELTVSGKPLSKNIRQIIETCFSDRGFCCLLSENIMSNPVSLSTISGGLYIADRSSLMRALEIKKENPWNRDPATQRDFFPQSYLKSTIEKSVIAIQKLMSTTEFVALAKQFDKSVASKHDVMAGYIKNIIANRVGKILDNVIAEVEAQREFDITERKVVKFHAPLPEVASIETDNVLPSLHEVRLSQLLMNYMMRVSLNRLISDDSNFHVQEGYPLAHTTNSQRALPAPPPSQARDFHM